MMHGPAHLLSNADTSYMDTIFFDNKGKFIVYDSDIFKGIPINHIALFCHRHGIYGIPTTELIDWISHLQFFDKSKTIEIGAGIGALGRALGIKMTDSKLQEKEFIKKAYAAMGQPVIKYPKDVIRKEAMKAIEHYKPEIVIGSWVTHKYDEAGWSSVLNGGNLWGVEEDKFLQKVKYYILIGNKRTHAQKPIMSIKHTEYQYDWLYSRSMHPEDNFIAIWEGIKND